LNVDLAPDGTIELLNANEQLSADDGRIVIVDQTGEERALALKPEPRPGP
jgi:hypothetical protein